MKIAFIGLGNMGGGMAANLVKAGHDVQAFDLSAEALARAQEQGCTPCTTVREAVQGVDAVVSMLPNGKIVEAVYSADVIGAAPQSAILLDCSTIDVASARDGIGQQVVRRKVFVLGFAEYHVKPNGLGATGMQPID